MQLKLLADESLDFRIVTDLMHEGFETISVLKDYRGISDKEVMNLAKKFKSILITEDSDFGEWVFAHKEKDISVIFLRYRHEDIKEISSSLIKIIKKYNVELYGKFIVITVKKIRIREL